MYRRHLLASLFAAACAPPPALVSGGVAPQAPSRPPARAPARFRFRCDLWVSLHHVLFDEGERKAKGEAAGRAPPGEPGEARAWAEAVDAYARDWSKRDLLFDDAMSDIRAALLEGAGEGSALSPDGVDAGGARADDARPPRGLPPSLEATFARVGPVYRARFWADDRASAGRWLRGLAPLVDAHGEAIVAGLERAFGTRWPAAPVTVDVVTRAGWGGAYTAARRQPGVTVGSDDPRNQGGAGLEILYHEASHLLVNDGFRDRIDRAFEARGAEAPRDFWHALLFYTAGELTRRRLGPGYVPYAERQGLWGRVRDWASYREAFEASWLSFLDGRVEAGAALAGVVERVAKPQSG
jgi:hypothetical protein